MQDKYFVKLELDFTFLINLATLILQFIRVSRWKKTVHWSNSLKQHKFNITGERMCQLEIYR